MNIIYITASDPRDPTSGSRQRSAFLLEALSGIGKVYTVVPVVDSAAEFYDKDHETRGVCFKSPNAVGCRCLLLFQQLTKLGRWPIRSSKWIRSRIGWGDVKFDIIVVRYLSYAAEIAAWNIAPCYVDIDDMPLQAFDLVEGRRLPAVIRPFCRLLLRSWQWYCLRRCKGAWAIVPEQRQQIERTVACGCLPNLARRPSPTYDVNSPQKTQLMTVGLMGYGPNSEGVDWFVDHVWPKVKSTWPELQYAIAGGELSPVLKAKWEKMPGVRVLGFVDDIDALYAESIAVVAPILFGAGTCIKVVEAGLRGRKVFATDVALRGQDAEAEGLWYERFDDATDLVSKLGAWLNQDDSERCHVQQEIAQYVSKINSISSFRESVEKVIRS